jgi:hypothetical protein
MDEAGARALMERLSTTEQPPSRVDIGLARKRGSALLRRRRWGLAGGPLLAAAVAVALVLGIGAITGPVGGPRIGPATRGVSLLHRFNPLAPHAAFGWLPEGVRHNLSSPGSTPSMLQLTVGSEARGWFMLTVWAPGACNLDAAQVRARLRRHHHPLLDCAQDASAGWASTLSGPAPAVGGRPGFWFAGHMLAWEYAPHAWATLYVSRRGTPIPAATTVKVAARVTYKATAKPVVRFPFRLTGPPASWRVLSAPWRATPDGLLAGGNNEMGNYVKVGPADGPVTGVIGQIVITPGASRCPFFRTSRESSKRVDLGAVKAIVTRFADPGARPYQGLCIPETNGLHVFFLEFREPGHAGYAFGGVTGVFMHHMLLLGPDPGNWTTRPLG